MRLRWVGGIVGVAVVVAAIMDCPRSRSRSIPADGTADQARVFPEPFAPRDGLGIAFSRPVVRHTESRAPTRLNGAPAMTSEIDTFSPEVLLSHAEWIRRLAGALVTDADAQEEVIQSTWRVALEQPPQHMNNLRGWLATVTRNVARKWRREQDTRLRHELKAPSLPSPRSPEDAVLRASLHQRVVAAVLSLAEPYRATIVLRFFDDMKTSEVAHLTNVPVETARTRLKRALSMLREKLAGEFAGENKSLQLALAPLVLYKAAIPVFIGKAAVCALVSIAVCVPSIVFLATRTPDTPVRTEVTSTADAGNLSAPVAPVAEPPPQAVRQTVETSSEGSAGAAPPENLRYVIEGTVYDSVENPASEAMVYLGKATNGSFESYSAFMRGISSLSSSNGHEIGLWRRAVSNGNGMFRFEEVDAFETLSIGAVHSTLGTAFQADVRLDPQSPTRQIDLRLVAGKVFRGRLTDASGAPVGQAWVCVDALEEVSFERISLGTSCTTDENGGYATHPIPCTHNRYQISADGFRVILTDREEMPPGTPEIVRDFVLTRTSELRGRILALDGGPASLRECLLPLFLDCERERQSQESFAIIVSKDDPRTAPRVLQRLSWKGDSWSGGATTKYGTIDLESDAYVVEPVHEAHFVSFLVRGEILGVAPVVDPDSGPDVLVDLEKVPRKPRSGRLRVLATHSENGDLLECLTVNARKIDLSRNEDWFLLLHELNCWDHPLERTVPAGDYVLWAGRLATVEDVVFRGSVEAGDEVTSYEVALHRATTSVRGSVLDVKGDPVKNALLLTYRRPEGWLVPLGNGQAVRTDVQGRFEIGKISVMPHWVIASSPDFAPAAVQWDATLDVNLPPIEFETGCAIKIRVHSTDGSPVKSPWLRILDPQGAPLLDDFVPRVVARDFPWWARLDEIRLDEGSYRLEVYAAGFEERHLDIEVIEGAIIDVALAPRR